MKPEQLSAVFEDLVTEVGNGLTVVHGGAPANARLRSFLVGRIDGEDNPRLSDAKLIERLKGQMLRFRSENPLSKTIFWFEKPNKRKDKIVEFAAQFALSDLEWDYRG